MFFQVLWRWDIFFTNAFFCDHRIWFKLDTIMTHPALGGVYFIRPCWLSCCDHAVPLRVHVGSARVLRGSCQPHWLYKQRNMSHKNHIIFQKWVFPSLFRSVTLWPKRKSWRKSSKWRNKGFVWKSRQRCKLSSFGWMSINVKIKNWRNLSNGYVKEWLYLEGEIPLRHE